MCQGVLQKYTIVRNHTSGVQGRRKVRQFHPGRKQKVLKGTKKAAETSQNKGKAGTPNRRRLQGSELVKTSIKRLETKLKIGELFDKPKEGRPR